MPMTKPLQKYINLRDETQQEAKLGPFASQNDANKGINEAEKPTINGF